MSNGVLEAPRKVRRQDCHEDMRELLNRLGDIPAERIRLWPPPGLANLNDLIAHNDGDHRGAICELVEGTLVEKPMGVSEARAASVLLAQFEIWNDDLNLGFFLAPDGNVRLKPGLARAPDAAFYSWEQYPDRRQPDGSVPLMHPDLAVEILSKSNTKKEMARKRREYFESGTRIVWEVDLKKQIVVVYHDAERGTSMSPDDTLDGGDVMPGFALSIRKWFDRCQRNAD